MIFKAHDIQVGLPKSPWASCCEFLILQPHKVIFLFIGVISVSTRSLLIVLISIRRIGFLRSLLRVLLGQISRLILLVILRILRGWLIRDAENLLVFFVEGGSNWLIAKSLYLLYTCSSLLGRNGQIYEASLSELNLSWFLLIILVILVVQWNISRLRHLILFLMRNNLGILSQFAHNRLFLSKTIRLWVRLVARTQWFVAVLRSAEVWDLKFALRALRSLFWVLSRILKLNTVFVYRVSIMGCDFGPMQPSATGWLLINRKIFIRVYCNCIYASCLIIMVDKTMSAVKHFSSDLNRVILISSYPVIPQHYLVPYNITVFDCVPRLFHRILTSNDSFNLKTMLIN